MKITENSAARLVVNEGSVASRITGIVLVVVSVLIFPATRLYALIGVGMGILLALGAKKRRLIIDKSTRTVSYAQKSIFKNSNKVINFAEVKNVQLHKKKQVLDNPVGNYVSTTTSVVGILYLNLVNGEEIFLNYDTKKKRLFKSVNQTIVGNEALGTQIAAAIGVPFISGTQTPQQPTVQN